MRLRSCSCVRSAGIRAPATRGGGTSNKKESTRASIISSSVHRLKQDPGRQTRKVEQTRRRAVTSERETERDREGQGQRETETDRQREMAGTTGIVYSYTSTKQSLEHSAAGTQASCAHQTDTWHPDGAADSTWFFTLLEIWLLLSLQPTSKLNTSFSHKPPFAFISVSSD